MSTAKKILGNTAVQVVGRAIMAASSVVILKIITMFLGVEGYGMYANVYEFLAFFGIAADLGLFTIAVREMSKGERDRDFIVSNILGMRMVMAILAMAVAIVTVFLIPQYAGTPIPFGVAIASMAVFLSILHGTVSSVLQVEYKMQYATAGLVGAKLIALGWMAGVIFWFYAGDPSEAAFYQLIMAGVVGNLFAFLYTLFYALKHAKIRPSFNRGYWQELFFTAVPYGLALILNMVYFRIDSLMISLMVGPKELGYYSPAVRMLEILSVIPIYFMNSVLPVMSRAVKGSAEKLKRVLTLSFDFLFMLGLPVAIGVFLLAYPIVALTTQPEFLTDLSAGVFGSDMALQILVFAMFFAYLNSLFTYSLLAVNKQNHLLWINGSAALFNIVANYFVIPEYGFRGASATSIITEIYILLLAFLVARRYMKYEFDWVATAKTVMAAVVMAAVVIVLKEPTYELWGLENLNVILLSVIGASVYGGLLLLMGAIPPEFTRKLKARL